ncbi:heparin lyase I family protein [Streptomyces sp. NPDC055400]
MMRRHFMALPAVALAWCCVVASPASAAAIWDGDATQDTGVFPTVECNAPGSLVTAAQTDGHGTVFRYTKGTTEWRCESRGIKADGCKYVFQNNATYYLGWESKVDTVTLPNSGDFVVFQWKSYPEADQNYPLLMTFKNGAIHVYYVAPGEVRHEIWSAPVAVLDWHRFAVGIHTSDSTTGGWVELWFDGVKQTFNNGAQHYVGRTWDSANEPKWGVYDRDNTTDQIINRVDSQKVGTTYGDVD